MTSFNLRQVKLRPGEQLRDELEVELEPFQYGGQRYLPVPEKVPAAFELTRATTGTVFTLAFTARAARAVLPLPRRRGARGADPRARVPGVVAGRRGADDAVHRRRTTSTCRRGRATRSRSALPEKILCRPDCAGLCGECGKNLNDEPHVHEESTSDPRWAALEALRDQV